MPDRNWSELNYYFGTYPIEIREEILQVIGELKEAFQPIIKKHKNVNVIVASIGVTAGFITGAVADNNKDHLDDILNEFLQAAVAATLHHRPDMRCDLKLTLAKLGEEEQKKARPNAPTGSA